MTTFNDIVTQVVNKINSKCANVGTNTVDASYKNGAQQTFTKNQVSIRSTIKTGGYESKTITTDTIKNELIAFFKLNGFTDMTATIQPNDSLSVYMIVHRFLNYKVLGLKPFNADSEVLIYIDDGTSMGTLVTNCSLASPNDNSMINAMSELVYNATLRSVCHYWISAMDITSNSSVNRNS